MDDKGCGGMELSLLDWRSWFGVSLLLSKSEYNKTDEEKDDSCFDDSDGYCSFQRPSRSL